MIDRSNSMDVFERMTGALFALVLLGALAMTPSAGACEGDWGNRTGVAWFGGRMAIPFHAFRYESGSRVIGKIGRHRGELPFEQIKTLTIHGPSGITAPYWVKDEFEPDGRRNRPACRGYRMTIELVNGRRFAMNDARIISEGCSYAADNEIGLYPAEALIRGANLESWEWWANEFEFAFDDPRLVGILPISIFFGETRPVAAVTNTTTPPPNATILETLRSWIAAWRARDIDLFSTFYAKEFVASNRGLTRAQWLDEKRQIFAAYDYINVSATVEKIAMLGNGHARVEMLQSYVAKSEEEDTPRRAPYRDFGRVTLDLVLRGDSWLIVRQEWRAAPGADTSVTFDESLRAMRVAFPKLFLSDVTIAEADDVERPMVFGEPDPPEGFAGPDPTGRHPLGIYLPAGRPWPASNDISREQWILHEMFHLNNRRTKAFDRFIDAAFPDESDPLVQWMLKDPYHRSFAREEAFINLVTFADPARTRAQKKAVADWYAAIGAERLGEDLVRRVLNVVPH
jgi:hypothetical protein